MNTTPTPAPEQWMKALEDVERIAANDYEMCRSGKQTLAALKHLRHVLERHAKSSHECTDPVFLYPNPTNPKMNIGEAVINEIISREMMSINFPDPGNAHVIVWAGCAAEQLDAFIRDSAEVQIPTRAMILFGEALRLLGAPDNGNPHELLAWAKEKGAILDSLP